MESAFKTIVLTRENFFLDEAEQITRLLEEGRCQIVHLRKPGSTQKQMEALIRTIPEKWHQALVLHDHHALALSFNVFGIHLNRRNPKPLKGFSGSISRSCHSLEEIRIWKPRCSYVSLSPIFDSISKMGYRSAFSVKDIALARKAGLIDEKVMALGGVTFKRLDQVKDMGFGGAMILGDAWK